MVLTHPILHMGLTLHTLLMFLMSPIHLVRPISNNLCRKAVSKGFTTKNLIR
jgi:hypothetical protein